MGLTDIVQKDESEENKNGERDDRKDRATPRKKVEEIRSRLFLNEFCEDLGILIKPPEDKEYTSWGSVDIEEPLPEGYIDCTDRVEYTLSVTKWFDCPHCNGRLRQDKGGSGRRDSTWARCKSCSRILVDLEAENRDSEGNVVEQQGISSWI